MIGSFKLFGKALLQMTSFICVTKGSKTRLKWDLAIIVRRGEVLTYGC